MVLDNSGLIFLISNTNPKPKRGTQAVHQRDPLPDVQEAALDGKLHSAGLDPVAR